MQQKLRVKQKSSTRAVVLVVSSSIVLIIVAMLFVFNVGNIRSMLAGGKTSTTVKDGSWNDPTIWSNGAVPAPGNAIVIANNVTNSSTVSVVTVSFTLNPGATLVNTGSLTIGTAGSPATVTLNKSSSITNGIKYEASYSPVLIVYGSIVNNSGSIIDNGHLTVSQSVTSNSTITNNDSMVVGTNFTNNPGGE